MHTLRIYLSSRAERHAFRATEQFLTGAQFPNGPSFALQTPGNPAPGTLTAAAAAAGAAAAGGLLASPASSNGSMGRRRADFGGSHGSLDALASGPERESFFALLRDLGAQSSSGSSTNGNGSLVPSRSSPERDLDDPVHAKPVGCAPSRLAELLKPNFSGSNRLPEPSFTFLPPQAVAR